MKIKQTSPSGTQIETTISKFIYELLDDYQIEDIMVNVMNFLGDFTETLVEKGVISMSDVESLTGTFFKLEPVEKIWVVRTRELWLQDVQVSASNKEEAMERVLDGEGEEIGPAFFCCSINDEDWEIYPKEGTCQEIT